MEKLKYVTNVHAIYNFNVEIPNIKICLKNVYIYVLHIHTHISMLFFKKGTMEELGTLKIPLS